MLFGTTDLNLLFFNLQGIKMSVKSIFLIVISTLLFGSFIVGPILYYHEKSKLLVIKEKQQIEDNIKNIEIQKQLEIKIQEEKVRKEKEDQMAKKEIEIQEKIRKEKEIKDLEIKKEKETKAILAKKEEQKIKKENSEQNKKYNSLAEEFVKKAYSISELAIQYINIESIHIQTSHEISPMIYLLKDPKNKTCEEIYNKIIKIEEKLNIINKLCMEGYEFNRATRRYQYDIKNKPDFIKNAVEIKNECKEVMKLIKKNI
jgi:hypothetical protein